MKPRLESEIDDLYRQPLDAFTSARNALAKTRDGSEKKHIASLVKPSLPMWVINQLYWQDTSTYKALVDASEKLRSAHLAALSGRKADTQKSEELHRTTLQRALTKAVGLADKQGVRLTAAARESLRRTLAALPSDEADGRLTREPPPAGFSLLTGVKPQPQKQPAPSKLSNAKKQSEAAREAQRRQQAAAKLAEKQRRDAERKARQDADKARQEQRKREREIEKAELALREAERRLAELKG